MTSLRKIACGLLSLLFLAACGEDEKLEKITFSKDRVTIAVGETLSLFDEADGQGDIAITLSPTNLTYELTSANPNVATVENKQIKAIAPGTTVITAKTKKGASASLNVEVVEKQQEVESITLSVDALVVEVGKPVTFASKSGDGVDVVVTTVPETDFTLTASDVDRVQIKGLTATPIVEGSYTITVKAGNKSADLQLVAASLKGAWLGKRGAELVFVPEKIADSWKMQDGLKAIVTQEPQWLFEKVIPETKTVQFISREQFNGKFSLGYTHVAYVVEPADGSSPHIDCIYKKQRQGMFELGWVAFMAELGFTIDMEAPPMLDQDENGDYFYEANHPVLPIKGRIFFKELTGSDGKLYEDIHVHLSPVVSIGI